MVVTTTVSVVIGVLLESHVHAVADTFATVSTSAAIPAHHIPCSLVGCLVRDDGLASVLKIW